MGWTFVFFQLVLLGWGCRAVYQVIKKPHENTCTSIVLLVVVVVVVVVAFLLL